MESSKMYEQATEWAFDTNGDKWSNNNNEAADNHRSFIAGWRAAESEHDIATLQSKCDRYEKALREIADQAKYSPGNSWADIAYIMKEKALNAIANEALNGEGEKESAITKICHVLAEEVAKDAGTAEEYLKKEGVDVAKVKEDAKFITWLAELAALLHGAAQGQPIKINQDEARKWYDDGATPYQCFRETWDME